MLPSGGGWSWSSMWEVDRTVECDSDGWSYAFDFGSTYHNKNSSGKYVRRRRWVRTRVPNLSESPSRLVLYNQSTLGTTLTFQLPKTDFCKPFSIEEGSTDGILSVVSMGQFANKSYSFGVFKFLCLFCIKLRSVLALRHTLFIRLKLLP